MITVVDAQKVINVYRPIQIEIQKVIFLMRQACRKDNLLYIEHSPQAVIDYLEQADEVMGNLLCSIQDSGDFQVDIVPSGEAGTCGVTVTPLEPPTADSLEIKHHFKCHWDFGQLTPASKEQMQEIALKRGELDITGACAVIKKE